MITLKEITYKTLILMILLSSMVSCEPAKAQQETPINLSTIGIAQ